MSGVSIVPCRNDRVAEVSLRFGASEERISNGAERDRLTKILGLGLLEAGCELVSVVKDLLCGARHRSRVLNCRIVRMARSSVHDRTCLRTPVHVHGRSRALHGTVVALG